MIIKPIVYDHIDRMIGRLLHRDRLTKSVVKAISKGRPRIEYVKQITIDTEKDSHKELKGLWYRKDA